VLISFCRKEKSCVLATEILFYKEKKRKIIATEDTEILFYKEKKRKREKEKNIRVRNYYILICQRDRMVLNKSYLLGYVSIYSCEVC